MYFPLNDKGEKSGLPFKASLFGKTAGIAALELQFAKCKTTLKDHPSKQTLKSAIISALQSTSDELSFKKQLAKQGINVVTRRNDTGRVYGITFIDHNSKTVLNGSSLGKELSVNTFSDYWNHNIKPEIKDQDEPQSKVAQQDLWEDLPTEKPHELFDFLDNETPDRNSDLSSIIDGLGGLLPDAQGDDYEELDFANRMKKTRKRKKGRP